MFLNHLDFVWQSQLIDSHVANGGINDVLQSEALNTLAVCLTDCVKNWEGEKEVSAAARSVCATLKICAAESMDAKVCVCKNVVPLLTVRWPMKKKIRI